MARASKREELIQTATRLFSEHGFHATGIDMILRESGLAKKTLYNHFRSKDELIYAVLQHYDGLARNHFIRETEELAQTPRERLIALFDVARNWFDQKDFYGCMFINAIGEYSGEDTRIRRICKEYKRLMREYMISLADEAGAVDPEGLADEIFLLYEGATVTAQVNNDASAADVAKRAAEALIDRAIPAKTKAPR